MEAYKTWFLKIQLNFIDFFLWKMGIPCPSKSCAKLHVEVEVIQFTLGFSWHTRWKAREK